MLRSWTRYIATGVVGILFWSASAHIMIALLLPLKGVTVDWTNPGNGWVLGLSIAFGFLGCWGGGKLFDRVWRDGQSRVSSLPNYRNSPKNEGRGVCCISRTLGASWNRPWCPWLLRRCCGDRFGGEQAGLRCDKCGIVAGLVNPVIWADLVSLVPQEFGPS